LFMILPLFDWLVKIYLSLIMLLQRQGYIPVASTMTAYNTLPHVASGCASR